MSVPSVGSSQSSGKRKVHTKKKKGTITANVAGTKYEIGTAAQKRARCTFKGPDPRPPQPCFLSRDIKISEISGFLSGGFHRLTQLSLASVETENIEVLFYVKWYLTVCGLCNASN